MKIFLIKKVIYSFFTLTIHSFYNSQIIKCEEIKYSLKYDDTMYSTYHFVKSDYSMRGFQVFVTNEKIFQQVKDQIPQIINKTPKQNTTDFYVLGIENFEKLSIDKTEKIIENFINEINEYRYFNKLSTVYNKEFINEHILRYISDTDELCKFMICEKIEK